MELSFFENSEAESDFELSRTEHDSFAAAHSKHDNEHFLGIYNPTSASLTFGCRLETFQTFQHKPAKKNFLMGASTFFLTKSDKLFTTLEDVHMD